MSNQDVGVETPVVSKPRGHLIAGKLNSSVFMFACVSAQCITMNFIFMMDQAKNLRGLQSRIFCFLMTVFTQATKSRHWILPRLLALLVVAMVNMQCLLGGSAINARELGVFEDFQTALLPIGVL